MKRALLVIIAILLVHTGTAFADDPIELWSNIYEDPITFLNVVDGAEMNDNFWIFAASQDDVGYSMTVIEIDKFGNKAGDNQYLGNGRNGCSAGQSLYHRLLPGR